MNKSKELQDFHTSLEEYLLHTLAEEKLSAAAQIKRRHLLDQFYSLNLQTFVIHKSSGVNSGSSANLSSIKKIQTVISDDKTRSHSSFVNTSNSVNDKPISKNLESKSGSTVSDRGTEKYFEIVVQNGKTQKPPADDIPLTDEEGSESEKDIDEDDGGNINHVASSKNFVGERILLPRPKCPPPVPTMNAVVYVGYLYQKGLITWTKRYCVISEQRLFCFRSDKDSKPLQVISLASCDITCVEKDDKIILRISSVGGETNWFHAESKELSEPWIKNLTTASIVTTTNEALPTSIGAASSCTSSAATELNQSEASLQLQQQQKSDNESSLSNNSSTIFENQTASGTSSEAGSGDGMVTSSENNTGIVLHHHQPVIDRRKKSRLGESLQSLLSTFNKKKSDRLKRSFLESGQLEPETHVAGYVNICSELAEKGRWVKRFCAVRRGRLDCYCDPLDEYIEFSILLWGAQIDFLDRKMKKEFAVQIIQGGREILLEAYNETDYNRWMKILICETGCMSQKVTHSKVRNGDEQLNSEDIYDEVYNWEVYDEITGGSSAPVPPPLPKVFPPLTSQSRSIKQSAAEEEQKENDYLEPQTYETMFDEPLRHDKDDSIDLETAVNNAFFNIRDGFSRVTACQSTPGRERSTSLSPASLHRRSKPSVERSRLSESPLKSDVASNLSSDSESNVIKCRRGPTIAEDKELLDTTQNPLLQKIRVERERRQVASVVRSAVDDKITQLKKSSEDLKKRRKDLEMSAVGSQKKADLPKQLESLNKQIQSIDTEIKKLTEIAEQSESRVLSDRGKSQSVTTSSRNSITSLDSYPGSSNMGSIQETFLRLSKQSSSMRASSSTLQNGGSSVHRCGSLDISNGFIPFTSSTPTSSPQQPRKQLGSAAERRAQFLENLSLKSDSQNGNVLSDNSTVSGGLQTGKITATRPWSSSMVSGTGGTGLGGVRAVSVSSTSSSYSKTSTSSSGQSSSIMNRLTSSTSVNSTTSSVKSTFSNKSSVSNKPATAANINNGTTKPSLITANENSNQKPAASSGNTGNLNKNTVLTSVGNASATTNVSSSSTRYTSASSYSRSASRSSTNAAISSMTNRSTIDNSSSTSSKTSPPTVPSVVSSCKRNGTVTSSATMMSSSATNNTQSSNRSAPSGTPASASNTTATSTRVVPVKRPANSSTVTVNGGGT